ncbi:MAG TPA: c-type cytochrome biogenesis protein CcsB [Actinophytocola sp.]|uniref:c-type cytochrome biogenesis protein CcsB n=1 Tax=Actinophytocola sp. TaxID=1872138 RepID=UPI002DDD6D35|nr:c-type cytochrome biogenesis protein CcsB [Actinophytocola sp.]HEV2778268.1 c-type cytochrome biogenesis protein CcsB [Actinophytocola sp.]
MPVNEALSTYSDWTYGAAVAIYVLAMVFHFVEQAMQRTTAPAEAEVLVGAGGPELDGRHRDVAVPPRSRPGRAERFGRMAVSATVLGALVHLASLVLRGLAAERVPWGNMYEFGSVLCLGAVATWLVLLRRFPVRHLGGFVLAPIALLMFLGGTVLYTAAAPVQPALQSYWLVIHVFTVATSSGALLVPGVASLLYLIKVNPDRFARLAPRLPGAETLDRVAYRITIMAFPAYTLAIIFGAIWAEAAWGRFWGWDPKETCAFVAWVVYAAYLHSRATAGWRGSRAAAINTLGFAVMVFNLFFINLVISGLHSYAGLG